VTELREGMRVRHVNKLSRIGAGTIGTIRSPSVVNWWVVHWDSEEWDPMHATAYYEKYLVPLSPLELLAEQAE